MHTNTDKANKMELTADQKILSTIPYGDDPSDLDVFIIKYHINSNDEIQSHPINLTDTTFKEWREAIEAELATVTKEPIIAWTQMPAEFEFATYPPDSGWYVQDGTEAVLES